MNRWMQKLECITDFGNRLAGLSCCRRLKVGCVVFSRDFSQVHAIGYNGPPRGSDNAMCTGAEGDCGCAHAEANAIAMLDSRSVRNAVLYTTTAPCPACANLIANCQAVSWVIYACSYRDGRGILTLSRAGIQVTKLDDMSEAPGASLEGSDT